MAAPIPESGNAPEGVFTPPMPKAEKPIDDPPPVDISPRLEDKQ